MNKFLNITDKIFNIDSFNDFNETAIEIFLHQYKNNVIYQKFVDHLSVNIKKIEHYKQIPFLPVDFFKSHKIITGKEKAEKVFLSSGTTGTIQSKHFVSNISVYEKSIRKGFEFFYGDIRNYCILALLPSYLEKKGSSLVYMVNDLIKQSKHKESGFYLNNITELVKKLIKLNSLNQKVILIGVTYALLDIAENHSLNTPNLILIETGGMKGKRKELIREELHNVLCKGFNISSVHSEYGMTELLSQAYSKGKGIFKTPPWMKILIRDINDPLTIIDEKQTGGINIIDLANINSCSFIATHDLGKNYNDGSFEVLGRFDISDIRGCNLMIY